MNSEDGTVPVQVKVESDVEASCASALSLYQESGYEAEDGIGVESRYQAGWGS